MLGWIDEKYGAFRGEELQGSLPAPAFPVPPIHPTVLHSRENFQRPENPQWLGGHAFKRVPRRSERECLPVIGPFAGQPLAPHESLYQVPGHALQSHVNLLHAYSLNASGSSSQYCSQSSSLKSYSSPSDWLSPSQPLILSNPLHYRTSPPALIDTYSLDRLPYRYDVDAKVHDIPHSHVSPTPSESLPKSDSYEAIRPYPAWKSVRPTNFLPPASPPSEKKYRIVQGASHLPRKKALSQTKREDQSVMDLMAAMKVSISQDKCKSSEYKHPVSTLSDIKLKNVLKPKDYEELMSLLDDSNSTLLSTLCQHECTDTIEGLGRLYGLFVECKSLFFTRVPLFRHISSSDKPRILRLAVAISTHICAAQHMDPKTFTWEHSLHPESCSPILSVSTLRQILSHDHFIMIMKFYTNYCHIYADPKISLLTEVLSLFYDEPGMADPRSVSSARSHYLALLSRYLTAVHGWQRGSDILRSVLKSQREARQLTEIYQHVEFCNQYPYRTITDVTSSLAKNFMKMQSSVQDIISKHKSQQQNQQSHSPTTFAAIETSSAGSSGVSSEEADMLTSTLSRLATCNDPKVLAAAKQLLPPDLLRRLLLNQ